MNATDKQKIIACWKNEVESCSCKGQMFVYIDDKQFLLDNCNPQCIIDVFKNNMYLASYTHIESFVFDLENVYCSTYTPCSVKVSKKRKRD